MIDLAGGGQHQARGAVIGLEERPELDGAEASHTLLRAQDRPPNRLSRKGGLLQHLVGDFIGAVARCRDLLQDDFPLALELVLRIARLLQDIGQNIERDGDVGPENAREVGRGLQTRCRVEFAADRFNLLGDIAGAAPLGALEGHMFQQVRNPVLGDALVPGAGCNPHPKRYRLHMRHMVRYHAQAIGQSRKLRCHGPGPQTVVAHLST